MGTHKTRGTPLYDSETPPQPLTCGALQGIILLKFFVMEGVGCALGFLLVVCVSNLGVFGAPAPTLSPTWDQKLNETAGGVIFEGDMILPRKMVIQAVNEGNMMKKDTKVKSEMGSKVEVETITAPLFMRWPNGVVPYVIHKDLKCKFVMCWFRNPEKHIKRAMKEWTKNTCVTFREKGKSDRDYVHFVSADMGVCASHVGRTRGRQPLYLGKGCRKDGIIIHEIGHALGFFHEQSRPDRDNHITVHYDNIETKYWMNFKKYTTGISNMGTPYDYGSIMHYGKGSFSKSWFGRTITPKKSGVSIGQRKKLSPIDIREANLYYNCKK